MLVKIASLGMIRNANRSLLLFKLDAVINQVIKVMIKLSEM